MKPIDVLDGLRDVVATHPVAFVVALVLVIVALAALGFGAAVVYRWARTRAAAGGSGQPAWLLDRRSVIGAGLGALAAAVVAIPGLGFLLGPALATVLRVWRSVGAIDQFDIGATSLVVLADASPLPWAGVTARTAAWLRRESETEFIAFSVNCTHLGCPVRWLADADLFMCPCHGGVYYHDGRVAAGPPPHPLFRYPVRVRNGEVEVQTSPLPIA